MKGEYFDKVVIFIEDYPLVSTKFWNFTTNPTSASSGNVSSRIVKTFIYFVLASFIMSPNLSLLN
jgi:hypothetical protein